jgi:hypothetical protein
MSQRSKPKEIGVHDHTIQAKQLCNLEVADPCCKRACALRDAICYFCIILARHTIIITVDPVRRDIS